MANKIQPQTILYPKNGYYITKSGKNEFFDKSKTLSSSNEILYIDYQKTEIESDRFFYYALLQLNVVRVVGTASTITLNVYIANEGVTAYTGWSAVSSSGVLRGVLLNSQTVSLTDDNEVVHIDIYNFAQNHMYGDSGKTGIIIEMVPNSGDAAIKIVGLHCWDNDVGEKQNPVIQLYYGQTPSAYIESKRISQAVSANSYVDSYNINANYGNEDLVRIEINGDEEKRALFKFNLSEIPAGSYVQKAILYLPKNILSATEGQKDFIYKIIQDWDEDYVTWLNAKNEIPWEKIGVYFDNDDLTNSYNKIVDKESNKYDITKLLQIAVGSFGNPISSSFYGLMFKGQNLIFSSKSIDDAAYVDVVYSANLLNQPPEALTLDSPASGTVITTQPTFIATINDDNAYGSTEGDDLNFRIEISKDISFSTINIVAYSTSSSTTGWHWSLLGDFSDDSTTFPIPTGGYTPGTSKVKFVMSETTDILAKGYVWNWRMVVIDE